MKFIVFVVIVIGGFLAFRYTPLAEFVRPQRIKAFFGAISAHWWAPVIYVVLYACACLVAFPGSLLTIMGGVTFGTVAGTLYVIAASNLGASLAFFLARALGREFVAARLKGKLSQLDKSIGERGFLRVLQLRLIPMVPFNVLNFACGLSRIRYVDYLLGSAIGMLPGTFVYVYSASSLAQLYFATGAGAEATAHARHTALFNVCFSVGLLILVSLVPTLYKRIGHRKVVEGREA